MEKDMPHTVDSFSFCRVYQRKAALQKFVNIESVIITN